MDACAAIAVAASGARTTSRQGEGDVLRIALIGCGHIGTVHSYALGHLTRAGLVDAAVTTTYDPDHERAVATARQR
jgi:predicted dehydrogenase